MYQSVAMVLDTIADVVGDDTSEERTERCEDLNLCERHDHQEVVRLEFYFLPVNDKVHRSMLHNYDEMVIVVVDGAARIDFRIIPQMQIIATVVVVLECVEEQTWVCMICGRAVSSESFMSFFSLS